MPLPRWSMELGHGLMPTYVEPDEGRDLWRARFGLEDAPEQVDRKQDEDDDDQDRDDAHCSPSGREFGSAASSPGRR
jgi:hypothetical protein